MVFKNNEEFEDFIECSLEEEYQGFFGRDYYEKIWELARKYTKRPLNDYECWELFFEGDVQLEKYLTDSEKDELFEIAMDYFLRIDIKNDEDQYEAIKFSIFFPKSTLRLTVEDIKQMLSYNKVYDYIYSVAYWFKAFGKARTIEKDFIRRLLEENKDKIANKNN